MLIIRLVGQTETGSAGAQPVRDNRLVFDRITIGGWLFGACLDSKILFWRIPQCLKKLIQKNSPKGKLCLLYQTGVCPLPAEPAQNKTPNWGGSDFNPSLDIDDQDGYGPENIIVSKLRDGKYYVVIDYYNDHGTGATDATLTMRLKGSQPIHFDSIHLPATDTKVMAVELTVTGGNITYSSSFLSPGNQP